MGGSEAGLAHSATRRSERGIDERMRVIGRGEEPVPGRMKETDGPAAWLFSACRWICGLKTDQTTVFQTGKHALTSSSVCAHVTMTSVSASSFLFRSMANPEHTVIFCTAPSKENWR